MTVPPLHVAIIMDGNGRWAKRRGLARLSGHRQGMEALRRIVRACPERGVRYLTVYAFSTENWTRPKDEVNGLMGLLVEYIEREVEALHREGVRIWPIGRLEGLPSAPQKAIWAAVERTRGNTRLDLMLALNYGGRKELVDACRAVALDVQQGVLSPDAVDEQVVASKLYTAGVPDPDIIIRPSGEQRLSNFLLWQGAYAEWFFSDVLWPDFDAANLDEVIEQYRKRERRYGGLGGGG